MFKFPLRNAMVALCAHSAYAATKLNPIDDMLALHGGGEKAVPFSTEWYGYISIAIRKYHR